jgi:hypothetical protein
MAEKFDVEALDEHRVPVIHNRPSTSPLKGAVVLTHRNLSERTEAGRYGL